MPSFRMTKLTPSQKKVLRAMIAIGPHKHFPAGLDATRIFRRAYEMSGSGSLAATTRALEKLTDCGVVTTLLQCHNLTYAITAGAYPDQTDCYLRPDTAKEFNGLTSREKWKYWEGMDARQWLCRSCESPTDGPKRAPPFPRAEVCCGDCDHVLTQRTGGGQSDPFNWIMR